MSHINPLHCNAGDTNRRPAANSSTCLSASGGNSSQTEVTAILDRLNSFLVSCPLPGLETEQAKGMFAHELSKSWAQHSLINYYAFQELYGYSDPNSGGFNHILGILELYQKGECDEAIWLAFISVLFGLELDTIRRLYGKFGEGQWDWKSVAGNTDMFRNYLRGNRERIMMLKFGNHRKYESNDPDKAVGIPNVILSFVDWVISSGADGPYNAFLSYIARASNDEEAFERSYKGLQVLRFGRTGKFDLLTLLGNLKVLPVQPGHCYLSGSTGPRTGALIMVTGRRNGRLTRHVDTVILRLQKHLGVPANVLEDALCNWQKY